MTKINHTIRPIGQIHFTDNLEILKILPHSYMDLIYVDPPFNTGKTQDRTQISTVQDDNGDRIGFQGKRYLTIKKDMTGFEDQYDEYLGFPRPRLDEAKRISTYGSFFFHIDYREVRHVNVKLDDVFSGECFMNEIIWGYDFVNKPKPRWPYKHDNILFTGKDVDEYDFHRNDIEDEPYMAQGSVTSEKAAMGKLLNEICLQTIVGTNGRERISYPTPKTLGILNRIITAPSNLGDHVLDLFAGSGTSGDAAFLLDRRFILVENNLEAEKVMAERFGTYSGVELIGYKPDNLL